MAKTLRERFAIIRDREEVIKEINHKQHLLDIYEQWSDEQQKLFLDYCTGMRGVKILYDQFFKLIINPESHPERLEEILSLILEQPVKILQVLPNESTKIAAEKSLLVLDIVVELQDKSIANIEVQRIGYLFPGQRCACYSADLLMRQYKRMKKQKKKNFRYSHIRKVFTIVFFEKSTTEFHKYPNNYIHRSKQVTDTGLDIDLLQEYIFVPLDIFRSLLHNKGINKNDKFEAWLVFLSEDEPKWILELIQEYPEFEQLYLEVYQACRDMEVMMGIFSKELIEMDKNTVDFMIDQMQNTIDTLTEEKDLLEQRNDTLEQKVDTLSGENKELLDLIAKLKAQLSEKEK